MCFRIDCEPGSNRIVLRVQGALVGWEAERLLRQEIVRHVIHFFAAVETGLADPRRFDGRAWH